MTTDDVRTLKRAYLEMLDDEERMEEGGYDDVMTSLGYVCMWTDGEVTLAGTLLGTFDEDGYWESANG